MTRTDCMECGGTGMPGGCVWCGVKEPVDYSYDLAELQTTVGEILARLEALEKTIVGLQEDVAGLRKNMASLRASTLDTTTY